MVFFSVSGMGKIYFEIQKGIKFCALNKLFCCNLIYWRSLGTLSANIFGSRDGIET